MNYTVTWTRHALRQFHDTWATATGPDAVVAIAYVVSVGRSGAPA